MNIIADIAERRARSVKMRELQGLFALTAVAVAQHPIHEKPPAPIHYEGNITLSRQKDINDFGNYTSISGFLDISGTNVPNLGWLEELGGGLYLENTPIITLGKLRKASWVDLRRTSVIDLSDLEEADRLYAVDPKYATEIGIS